MVSSTSLTAWQVALRHNWRLDWKWHAALTQSCLPAYPPPRHVGCQRPLAHRVSVAEFRPRPCWLNLPPLCSCVIMHDRLPLFCELQRDWVSFVIDYRHGSQSRQEEVFREKKTQLSFFLKKASSRVVITGNSTSSTTSRMGTSGNSTSSTTNRAIKKKMEERSHRSKVHIETSIVAKIKLLLPPDHSHQARRESGGRLSGRGFGLIKDS